jgi:YidC/Oxa1 family membrane protein insertase
LAEFSNPNQQGGGDNRSLLVMMVILVTVFFGLQYYRAKSKPQTAPPNAVETAAPPASQPANPAAAPGQLAVATPAATATPAVAAAAESTTTIENELYQITFANRGAQVTSWILKKYKDSDGKPLNLVHAQSANTLGYPLSLYTYDGSSTAIATASRNQGKVTVVTTESLPADMNGRAVTIAGVADNSYNGTYVVKQTGPNRFTYAQDFGDNGNSTGGTLSTSNGSTGAALNKALYVPSATGTVNAPATLTFKYSDGGVEVQKTFSFDETYVLHADVQVTRNGTPVRALLNWPGGFGDQDNSNAYISAQIDVARNGKEEHLAAKKVTGGETLNGPFDWAGTSDNYFAAIFLPDSPATATVATLHNQLDVAKTMRRTGLGGGAATKAVEVPILGAALGDTSGHTMTRIYAGPKAVNVLRAIHATDSTMTLEPLLDFGFFGPIGKYLFLALQFIHTSIAGWPGAWGWAIIILTILVNVLLLPLRIKTMQSGLKMQRIQPQMNEIKEKYKKYKATDPKRNEMNVEIMKLQKDHGVSMFGGCIPSLIQFPLLIAFFSMLPKVVELRQAHWFWLPDLSARDPYYILPIVMVVSQFLVQFYTPSPGVDPQQQKMMAFMMPAVTGYFVLNYASGLGLYWAVGNFINIVQQQIMNRSSLGREMRELAAKRARRKAGAPAPTIQGKR